MQLFFLAAATLSIIKLPSGSSISLLVESVELPVFEDFFMTFLGKNLVVTELKLTTDKKVKSSWPLCDRFWPISRGHKKVHWGNSSYSLKNCLFGLCYKQTPLLGQVHKNFQDSHRSTSVCLYLTSPTQIPLDPYRSYIHLDTPRSTKINKESPGST